MGIGTKEDKAMIMDRTIPIIRIFTCFIKKSPFIILFRVNKIFLYNYYNIISIATIST